ncbi:phytoene dehydrogenase [Neokomagataea thailandica NBRC 106555]|uniref:Phytoene desaturase n=2 Tax=Neokomagataea TaxID=1223423 RepID=A0A4Y6V5C9_9PROT|nr:MULTISPECIES: phytoene desaturase family protein [Neokomagataea]QDH25259.1 phytoene desaturase [Neokomagataea tanensis]GBR54279.1 phytoene dehydrogenase [Neokomagataea thailandica NBRC 106555]
MQYGTLKNRRVAIVGAGPGGLASAMLLARAGADVTLYERHGHLGGRSSSIDAETDQGRFRFDVGPTFFLYPHILKDIFERCGLNMEEWITFRKPRENYDLVFENGPSLRMTSDIDALEKEVAKIDVDDARNIRTFLADNREKFRVFIPVLQRPFNSFLDVFRTDMFRALSKLRPTKSIDQDLSTYFKNPKTRLAFSFQSKYLGMSPYRCPSLFTILSFMEYEYGIYHPIGGTAAVMEAMGKAAEQLGVRIKLNTPVREVLTYEGKANGVLTEHGADFADAVVVNADFARAMKQLVPEQKRRKWTNRRIEKQQYSCSTYMLYLGIEGSVPDKGHHTVFLSEAYDQNFSEIEEGKVLSEHTSLYVQNACQTDPGQAPDGYSTLYVLMPVGHLRAGGLEWTQSLKDEARSLVLKRLEKAGFKDIESRIRYEKAITPLEWERDYDVHKGAVFNLAHTLGQMLHLRPHNKFEDVKNMYLVGGGTHPGSGLPVIFEGARMSSDLLIRDLALHTASKPTKKLFRKASSHAVS